VFPVSAEAGATVAQRVVSAAAAVALLLAPAAHAFGPVSVKLDDIVVNRVDCAGGVLLVFIASAEDCTWVSLLVQQHLTFAEVSSYRQLPV
jgi:hypothetical protein